MKVTKRDNSRGVKTCIGANNRSDEISSQHSQQYKPEAVALRELRPFDLTAKDDQLPAKKSIFHHKIGSAPA